METRTPSSDVTTNASAVQAPLEFLTEEGRHDGVAAESVPEEVADAALPENPAVFSVNPLEVQDPHESRDTYTDELEPDPEGDPETPPADRGQEAGDLPLGSERTGTTASEERSGAALSERLAEELPDPALEAGSSGTGPDARTEALATEEVDVVFGSADVPDGQVEVVPREALAVSSGEGQADDLSGGDAGAAARSGEDTSTMPHGPA